MPRVEVTVILLQVARPCAAEGLEEHSKITYQIAELMLASITLVYYIIRMGVACIDTKAAMPFASPTAKWLARRIRDAYACAKTSGTIQLSRIRKVARK